MQPIRLYINIDHVATLREARQADEPDPIAAAIHCESAGADGITVHLREDRRHIQDADLPALAKVIGTVLNVELALASDVLERVINVRPYQATLVPERREEITTEGGLDIRQTDPRLPTTLASLQEAGIRTSLFLDPDPEQLHAAAQLGVAAVELHTGAYANSWTHNSAALETLDAAATLSRKLGLAVHAGHGLTYANVEAVARIAAIEELNIGHSVMARAMMVGMETAVREMVALVKGARSV